MLPQVGSTIVPPGFSSPLSSAASIIRTAMRSFTEPPGLKYSTLARTVGPEPSVTLLSLTSGVLPTRLIIESWNCTVVSGAASAVHRCRPTVVPPMRESAGARTVRRAGCQHYEGEDGRHRE